MDQTEPDNLELTVADAGQVRRVSLDKPGQTLIIGRSPPADVVLEDMLVSRQHARLSRDPFGRWIIEDLGSRNGLWIDGERITSRALTVGERVAVGKFVLALCPIGQPLSQAGTHLTSSLADDTSRAEIFTTRIDADQNISGRRLRDLNFIIDRLAEVASSRDLYGEACRRTARTPEETSLVLRLHRTGPQADKPPEILACHRGGGGPAPPTDGLAQAEGFRLSRRVIEAVRQSPQPVQASNLRFGGSQLQLTITDDDKPRAVLCVPIVVEDDWADLLYLDLPAEQAGPDSLDFARAVGRQVSFARKSIMLAEGTARSRIIDHQLSMAREIQSSLMPKTLDISPAVDVAVLCEPAMWVGGDYCDVWRLADGRLAMVVGDVSGKGLPAAMVMTNLQAALRTALDFCPDPAKALTHVSRHLEQHMPIGTFVTLFLGLLEPGSGVLEYVNAGHVAPLLAGPQGVTILGSPRNTPLGVNEGAFTTDTAVIAAGQAIVVVTDGVTEARSPQAAGHKEYDEFGSQRLEALVATMPSAASAELVSAIAKAAEQFRGPLPQHDDLTILALRRRDAQRH